MNRRGALVAALATAAVAAAGIAAAPARAIADDAPGRPPQPATRLAPPIESATWINSPPLRPSALEGTVRLVEFWTFGCVNCRRTIPAMKRLRKEFDGTGLVIVAVHTPEFDRERDARNVRKAVAAEGIAYPVALDNDYAIWKAFGNRYWPAIYLIDREGRIRRTHVGELHVGTPEWDDLTRDLRTLLSSPSR